MQSIRKGLQNAKTRILLAILDFKQVAAVNSQHFRHLDLSPAAFAPQGADTVTEANTNVSGHLPMTACNLKRCVGDSQQSW